MFPNLQQLADVREGSVALSDADFLAYMASGEEQTDTTKKVLKAIREADPSMAAASDEEVIASVCKYHRATWRLAGLPQLPTQKDLDMVPRFLKLESLKVAAKAEYVPYIELKLKRDAILEAKLMNDEPIPDTIDEVQ